MSNVIHPADLINTQGLLKELARLPVFREACLAAGKVHLRVSRSQKRHGAWGHAIMGSRPAIRLTIAPWTTGAEVASVLLHEMVHLVARDRGHGERFRRTLARAAREAWGIRVDPNPGPGMWPGGRRKLAAYVLDDAIVAALGPLVASGQVELPEPPPAAPRPSRAESAAALVERRAARAVAFHRRALHRLRLAKAAEERWRRKVRYYERRAAKRGQP